MEPIDQLTCVDTQSVCASCVFPDLNYDFKNVVT